MRWLASLGLCSICRLCVFSVYSINKLGVIAQGTGSNAVARWRDLVPSWCSTLESDIKPGKKNREG